LLAVLLQNELQEQLAPLLSQMCSECEPQLSYVLLMLYDAEQRAFLPVPGCSVWRFLSFGEQLNDCVFSLL
jgi:hypothetical protein